MIATDELILGSVQPKSFTTYASPTNASQQTVHFADSPSNSKSNKPSLTKSKSKSLGLSLRRITPDKKGKSNKDKELLQPSPTHESATGNSFVSRITGRSKLSINTGATPVMRGATSPMAQRSPSRSPGRRNNNIEKQQKMNDEYYSPSMKWAEEGEEIDEEILEDGDLPSLRRVNSKGSIQSWRAAAVQNTSANGATTTSAAPSYNDDGEYYDQDGRKFVPLAPPMEHPSDAAAAAAAAAAIALVTPVAMDKRNSSVTSQQLKVAGFWSQFDDNGDLDSTVDGDGDDVKNKNTSTSYDSSDDDDDDSGGSSQEDAPGDERQWRRSQSPPRNRSRGGGGGGGGSTTTTGTRDKNGRKVGFVEDIYNDDSTIGLDLIPMSRYGDDDDDTAVRRARRKQEQKEKEKDDGWNLLEKAACFNANSDANGNGVSEEEEYNNYDADRNGGSDDGGTFEEDDDQSLDRTYQTNDDSRYTGQTTGNKSGATTAMTSRTGASATTSGNRTGATSTSASNGRTRTTNSGGRTATTTEVEDDDEEETGMVACITVALAALCGYQAVNNSGSASRSTLDSKIVSDARRAGAALVSDGEDHSEDSSDLEDEEGRTEDAAIELQYHSDPVEFDENAAAIAAAYNASIPQSPPDSPGSMASSAWSTGDGLSPTNKKKKKGLRKLLQRLPSTKKSKRNLNSSNASVATSVASLSPGGGGGATTISSGIKDARSPPRKTLVTTTTRTGSQPAQGGDKSRVTDYLTSTSLTFEQELGLDFSTPPSSPGGGNADADGKMQPANSDDELNHALGDNDDIILEEGTVNDETTEGTKNTGVATAGAAAAMAAAALAKKEKEAYDDEEELESEAAAWSANKKNSYLRQLAERAKMEYAANAGSSAAASGATGDGSTVGGDGKSASGGGGNNSNSRAGLGLALGAAALGAAALATSQSGTTRGDTFDDTVLSEQTSAYADDDEDTMESTIGSIAKNDSGSPSALESNYTADYNSFSPTEKRQFLRLLNNGMSPQDAARTIASERNGGAEEEEEEDVMDGIEEEGTYEGTYDEGEGTYLEDDDGNGGNYSYDGEPTMEEEEEEEEEDGYVTDSPGEGPVERAAAYPMDEEMPSLMSQDPPGDNHVMRGIGSGESAELSIKDNQATGQAAGESAMEESNVNTAGGQHYAGLADTTQEVNKSSSRAKTAALAVVAVAALPLAVAVAPIAIVRAKSRSKSKERKQWAAAAQQQQEEEVQVQESRDVSQEAGNDGPTQTSILVSQEVDGTTPKPSADGLTSSGIGYYDASERESDNEDHLYESGLLEAPAPTTTRGRSRKGKLLGAAVASGLAAKVAATRQRSGEGGKARGSKYKNVSSSAPTTPNYDESNTINNASVSPRGTVSAGRVLSPRSPKNRGGARSSPKSPKSGGAYGGESKSDFTAKASNRTLTSALNFMQRKPIKMPRTVTSRKEWNKLDSDNAMDQVAPSMSLEVDGTPSWLLPKDEEMDVGEKEEEEGREEGGDGVGLGMAAAATAAAVGIAAVGVAAASASNDEESNEGASEATESIASVALESVASEASEYAAQEEDAGEELQDPPPISSSHRGHWSPSISAGKSPGITSQASQDRNIATPNSAFSTPGNAEDDDGEYDDITPQGSAFISPTESARSASVVSPQESHAESLALSPGTLSLALSPGSVTLSPTSPRDELASEDYSEVEDGESDAYSGMMVDEQQEEYDNDDDQYETEEEQYEDEDEQYEDDQGQYKGEQEQYEDDQEQYEDEENEYEDEEDSQYAEVAKEDEKVSISRALVYPPSPVEPQSAAPTEDQSTMTEVQTAVSESPTAHTADDDRSYISEYTYATNFTTASKSRRKRHKGAASKRMQQAKAAEGHAGASNKGWLGSIRDTASTRGQVWDPERGWIDYTKAEVHEPVARDYGAIGSLHLTIPKKRTAPKKEDPDRTMTTVAETEAGQDDVSRASRPVDFPEEWAHERATMITDDKSAYTLPAGQDDENTKYSQDIVPHDDDSVFDTMTVHSVNTADVSVFSASTAPTKRSRARHRSADRRKLHQQEKKKPIGWKESMQNATAAVSNDGTGRHWDYEHGWIKADGSMDDVSELSKSTLEYGNQSLVDDDASHVDRSKVLAGKSNVVAASHHIGEYDNIGEYDASPVVAEDSVAPSHLPSVAEEMLDDDSNAESASEAMAAPVAVAATASAAAAPTRRAAPRHRPTGSRRALLDDTASFASEATDSESEVFVAAASVPTRRSGSRYKSTDSRKLGIIVNHSPVADNQDLENDVVMSETSAQEREDQEQSQNYISPETISEDEIDKLSSSDDLDSPSEHSATQQRIGLPSLRTMGSGNSDKENQESQKGSSDSQSQHQYNESQKPPLPATKRSLNHWLEKASSNVPKPLDESEDAIMSDSRDTTSTSIRLNENKGSSASPGNDNLRLSQENLSRYSPTTIDPFQDSFNNDETPRSEVQVVKEHISDADSDLFEPPKMSDSFNNRIRESVARRNDDSRGIGPVMESFESENSSDSTSWIPNPPSPIKEEPSIMSEEQSVPGPPPLMKEEQSIMSERSGDVSTMERSADRSVSSRARAWMSSIEKSTQEVLEQEGVDRSQMNNNQVDSDVTRVNRVVAPPLDSPGKSTLLPSPGAGAVTHATSRAPSHAPWVNKTSALASPGESTLFSSLSSPGADAANQNASHAPSNAPSHAMSYAASNATSQKTDSPRSETGSSYIGTRNAKKASDSWIREKKDLEKEGSQSSAMQSNAVPSSSNAGSALSTASNSWIQARTKETTVKEEQSNKPPYIRQATQKTSNVGSDPPTHSNPWIRAKMGQGKEKDEEGNSNTPRQVTPSPVQTTTSLRSKSERKDSKTLTSAVESKKSHTTSVFVLAVNPEENDVYFRSSAMGIRLKRGEDGVVRVVSVTEATPGSSIVRDGAVEPEDMIMEAAGVDLRKPITNSQWGETVAKIRNAPRPMKFVVAGGPNRKQEETSKHEEVATETSAPPPAKFVLESRLSKSPEGQQVLQSLSEARSHDHRQNGAAANQAPPTPSALHYGNIGRRDDDSSASSARHEESQQQQQQPQKESFFRRMAACTAPVNAAAGCVSPARSAENTSTSTHHQQHNDGEDDGGHVPMAHLQFLRTNPTIARVTNAASRRYPAFCGRPDTIFEEPDDDDRESKASRTNERTPYPSSPRQPYGMGRSRSGASSTYDGSNTYAGSHTYASSQAPTLSTYGGTKATAYSQPRSTTSSGGSTGSGGTGGTGDNTAFLDKLALNSAVASKPTRPLRGNEAGTTASNTMTIAQKFGKTHSGRHTSQGDGNELGWPDDGGNHRQGYAKDTIDSVSTYGSSYQKNKKDAALQAELLAAANVEDMMNELHNVDPDDQCEI